MRRNHVRDREGYMEEKYKRLIHLLAEMGDSEWHVGRHTHRTIYTGEGGDDSIGRMDTALYAEMVVLCHEYARECLLGR